MPERAQGTPASGRGRTPFATPASRATLGWLAMAVAWLAGVALTRHGVPIVDELAHWLQVRMLLEGEWVPLKEWLTVVPGYHVLSAALLALAGGEALAHARLLNALLGLGALAAVFRMRRQLATGDAQRSSAQLLFLPLFAPYLLLVYTDVLALALLLWALAMALENRHGRAALLLLGAMLVRQNLVFWGALLVLPILHALWTRPRPVRAAALPAAVRSALPYVPVLATFLAYWAWNGSISFSNPQSEMAHPDVRFDVGNPVFLMWLAGALLPLHVALGLRRFAAAARRRRWLWLLPALLLLAYLLLFSVEHPYNQGGTEVYLRHRLLHWVISDQAPWLAFGVLASLAGTGMAMTRFAVPWGRWLLPLALLFVGASWLIEARYALVPFGLWLALRVPEQAWIERATLAWWVAVSAWLVPGVLGMDFML